MNVRYLCVLVLMACGDDSPGQPDASSNEPDASVDAMPDALVGVAGTEHVIKASSAEENMNFGRTMALSADGATLAVGTIRSATVDVFVRSGDTWAAQAHVELDPLVSDSFGLALSLSADGSRLAIGAPTEDGLEGAAYVYARTGTDWQQSARVISSKRDTITMAFGVAVALSADGETLAVGGSTFDSNTGLVNIFVPDGAAWTEVATLQSERKDWGDAFGYSLALDADGDTLAVGAPGEQSGARGVGGSQDDDGSDEAGAVFVFTRTGNTWAQQEYLKATNTGARDNFGYAVALSDDGLVIAAGAPDESSPSVELPEDDSQLGAGAVYLYRRNGTAWATDGFLKAAFASNGDSFGRAVALASSGAFLVVGVPGENHGGTGVGTPLEGDQLPDSGSLYLYEHRPAGWERLRYIKALAPMSPLSFGTGVGISADANMIAAGAPNHSSNATGVDGPVTGSVPNSGAVFTYE